MKDKTLANSNELLSKDESVTRLLIYLVKEFEKDIVFTGGTSLMKRNIIDRFSEDIDLIVKCSRKKIREFINELPNFEITSVENNSSVVVHRISNNEVNIKLDLASYKSIYTKENICGVPIIGIKSENNKVRDDELEIQVKKVELILVDKICAILESYDEIKMYNKLSPKKRRKIPLRRVRDFYDIYSIHKTKLGLSNKEITSLLEKEIIRRMRDSRSNLNLNFPKQKSNIILEINTLIDQNFDEVFHQIEEQVFSKKLNSRDMKESILYLLNLLLGGIDVK